MEIFVIFLMSALAFLFPLFLVRAVRARDKDTLDKNEILAGLSFAAVVLLMTLFIHS